MSLTSSLLGAGGGFLAGGPIGAAIGFGLGGGLGGSNQMNSTTTQSNIPWSVQQPYLQNVFGQAQNLYNQGGPQIYPYSSVSPLSQYQNQAIAQQAGLANNPQTTQAATDYYNNVLNGNYLTGGAGFNAALNAANAQITPMVASQFEGAGRYGSGAMGGQIATNLGNVFANLYQGERANQQNAFGMAPNLQSMQYANPSQLFQAGQAQQTQAQNELSDVANRYNYAQQLPYSNLQNFASTIFGAPQYSSTTLTQPYYRNQGAGILGGALAGSQLGGALGIGSGMGAGLGALLGLL